MVKTQVISPYLVRPVRRVGGMNLVFLAMGLYVTMDTNLAKESHKSYASYSLINRRKVPTKTVFETN